MTEETKAAIAASIQKINEAEAILREQKNVLLHIKEREEKPYKQMHPIQFLELVDIELDAFVNLGNATHFLQMGLHYIEEAALHATEATK